MSEQPSVILLVDDEKAFAEALAFRLATRGLPCLVADRGEQALALLDRRDLEVVLLDLNMPGLHGLDVLRLIKAKRPELEVLLLTGESDLAAAAAGMRRGAGDYLVKPVDFAALLESVDKARKRVREHKERLRAAEAGKLMALGALAAGVGHEINNPLQIILQRSEWLQELLEDARDGHPDFEELFKSARVIQNQAGRAGEITSQLLGLAQQSREGTARAEPAAIAQRVAGQYAARAAELGAALVLEAEPDLPFLPCSAAELEPVFSHLLRNALDAVEAAGNKPAEVRFSLKRHKGGVRITVTDTGEGIAPEYVPNIFDPFFSLRPVGKGTGLGLTVCHSIVAALRGHIAYAPAPGGGAVFTVDLAAGHEDAPSEAQ
ncbi:response regulator [Desulfovibrio sp. OttesenSCG-928-F20]|nr:response regulator [Desulfovibrio sp. OttesenSCG-928-F20]